jgi:hypothetical protein
MTSMLGYYDRLWFIYLFIGKFVVSQNGIFRQMGNPTRYTRC